MTGRTRVMKAIYLFKKEIWSNYFFNDLIPVLQDFVPWHYGPFSVDVFADIDFFVKIEFIERGSASPSSDSYANESVEEFEYWQEESSDSDGEQMFEYTEEQFTLTDKGIQYVEVSSLYTSLSTSQQKILKTFKTKICTIPLRQLLEYVYNKYPEDTVKSRIREQIM